MITIDDQNNLRGVPVSTRPIFRRPAALTWIVVAACVFCYCQSVGMYFAFDDFLWLRHAKQWAIGERGLFAQNFSNNFRPGTHLLVYGTYLIFGDWAPGYHVLSILFHTAAAVGLLGLLVLIGKDHRAALAGALLFAVAASQSETVRWVAGMPLLVAATFTLGALISSIRYAETGQAKWVITACLAILAALLTHELAVQIPIVVGYYALRVVRRQSESRGWTLAAGAVTTGLVYSALYVAYYLLRGQPVFGTGEPAQISASTALPELLKSLPGLLMPDIRTPAVQHRLPEMMPWLVTPLAWAWTLLMVIIPVWIGLAMLTGRPEAGLGSTWCLVGVGLGSLSSVGFAGRYYYLPMMGMALLVCSAASSCLFNNTRRASRLAAVGVLGVLIAGNLLANLISLSYLVRTSRQRHALVDGLRMMHKERAGQPVFVLSGLPGKYSDVHTAALFYGIRTARPADGVPKSSAVHLRYVPGGWKRIDVRRDLHR